MAIKGIFHVNVNCSDLDRSQPFYENLGFEVVHAIPEGGAPGMLRGLGLPPDSRARAAIMMLDRRNARGARLDLIEWKKPPTHGSPPSDLAHVGAVRIALWTKDIDAEYERLRADGIAFVSEPVAMAGARFCCFRDPDGTMLELIDFDSA
ncbi:MAG: VOC family protein [Myxococcales bacterium]|nr:VOC family protein [Myxococcales bacterium]